MAEENFASSSHEHKQFTYRLDTRKKLVVGIFVVIGIACSWVGSSQFTEDTYTSSFNAPAFMMWFSTGWMSLSYLPVIIYSLLMKKSIVATYRSCFFLGCCNLMALVGLPLLLNVVHLDSVVLNL